MNHDQIRDRMIAHTIDLVARQMTEVEPPSDLRARVIAALPATRRPQWLRFAIPSAAIAAVAIIAMMSGAVWLERSKGPTAQGSNGPGDVTTLRSVESPAVARRDLSSPVVTRRNPSLPADVPLPFGLAPLEEVTPLSISPIQPIAVSIAPITVTPIVTEPLTVPALDSRSGGRE